MSGPVPSILDELNVGAMISIQAGDLSSYVAQGQFPGAQLPVLTVQQSPPAGTADFVIAAYEHTQGDPTAKATIQQGLTVQPGANYWMAVPDQAGLSLPIVLGPEAQTMILEAQDDGFVTIQTSFAPPDPYIWWEVESGPEYLNYGHPAPYIQGLFTISVVG